MIRTYNDIDIDIIHSTPHPERALRIALDITMKKEPNVRGSVNRSTMKFLLKSGHTSVLEHGVISFMISGVSRSLVMQLTRHRMASYTVSSQHYQDYRDYDDIVSPEMKFEYPDVLERATENYINAIARGMIPEEARQVLPGAKACNLIFTINARSLVHLLNIRLCKRNVREMRTFALKLHGVANTWWPELFRHVGPDCVMFGECKQGHMKAEACKNGKKTT